MSSEFDVITNDNNLTIGNVLTYGDIYKAEVASLAIKLSILDATSILAITDTLAGQQKFNPENFKTVSHMCSKGNFNLAIIANSDLRVHFSPTSGPLILVYKKAGEMPLLSPLKTDINADPEEIDTLQSLYEQGGFRDMVAQATYKIPDLDNFYTSPKPYIGFPLPKIDIIGTFKFSQQKKYIYVITKIQLPNNDGFMQVIAYK